MRDCAGKIIEDKEALAVTSGLITKALTRSSMILTSKNDQLFMWIGVIHTDPLALNLANGKGDLVDIR